MLLNIEALLFCQFLSVVEKEKRFRELCDSLSEDEAGFLRKERQQRRNDEVAHNRALEIANAGRARNFWGN